MRYLLNYVAVLGLLLLSNDCGKKAQPIASEEESSPPTQFHYSQVAVLFTGGYADPSVIQMPDATFLMYLNRFGETGTGTFILSSDDAVSWKEETDIVFRGVATGRGFRFSNGVRFYYPRPERPPQFQGDTPPKNIVSSFSSNGIRDWQDEGILVEPRTGYSLGGPTVIRLKDGSYRMFFDEQDLSTVGPGKLSRGEIYAASSEDALTWTRDEAPTIVYSIRGADADAIHLADGTLRIYFGDFTPETSGIVYTAVLEVE